MTRLSVNIVCLNEAERIGRCLKSVAWADEIVLVDGGSTDGTPDIARSYGAKVIVHPFDDFSSQRNRALDASCSPWILSIDADEVVSPALATEIQRELATCPPYAAYRVAIHSWLFGRRFRFSGTANEYKLRLFRRDSARWEGTVHERPRVRGRVGTLLAPILHFSTPDVDVFLSKMRRYRALADSPRSRSRRLQAALTMFARRWLRHLGLLDGPEGLAFALLSAWEEWCSPEHTGSADVYDNRLLLRIARGLTGAGWRRGSTIRDRTCAPRRRLAGQTL